METIWLNIEWEITCDDFLYLVNPYDVQATTLYPSKSSLHFLLSILWKKYVVIVNVYFLKI